MKTTLKIKLAPTPKQHKDLLRTTEKFNQACNFIAQVAFDHKLSSKFKLQKLVYKDVRKRFDLSAQMAVRAIAKVADAYKRDKNKLCEFKPYGAIIYDERICSFKGIEYASLWTIAGRQRIAMVLGDYQKEQWSKQKGQADLVLIGNTFYLMATLDIAEESFINTEEFIGVDLGIIKLLVDSLGNEASAELIEKIRQKYLRLRRDLQKNYSKNAKRRLKKIARKEAEFRKQINHIISKAVVKRAKDTNSGIGLEILKYIRSRTTVRRADRARHSGWAFAQLQAFILYKAKIAGVPVIFVDPRNSSRECSKCHHIAKANRKSQAEFCCLKCGHSENADHNAAKVIAYRANEVFRASVNRPIAVHADTTNADSLELQAACL
ncbi:MAG: transposase [Acidobacteriota bacterium]